MLAAVAVAVTSRQTVSEGQVSELVGVGQQPQCVPHTQTPWKINDTCSFSYNRFVEGQNIHINSPEFACDVGSDGQYSDPSFPATMEGMMYWNSMLRDFIKSPANNMKFIKENFGISFKRPTELPESQGGSASPSLWGKNGVSPNAIR
jgi:hypothetical protein